MTIIYYAGMFILSIAFILSIFNIIDMIEKKSKVWILPILVVTGIILILYATQQPRLDKYYQVENPASYQELFPDAYEEGFNNGYEAAIKDAILVETTDTEYIISFNGEDNIYVCNITDVNNNN